MTKFNWLFFMRSKQRLQFFTGAGDSRSLIQESTNCGSEYSFQLNIFSKGYISFSSKTLQLSS